MKNEEHRADSYLTFNLKDMQFAINVEKVLEIVEMKTITRIPTAPDYMRGVLNLRGIALPVIDARSKFGLETASDTVDTCILVMLIHINEEAIRVGAVVDSVEQVVNIKTSDIEPSPGIGMGYNPVVIEGMWNQGESFTMLLDIDKLFTEKEALVFEETASIQQMNHVELENADVV